MAIELTFCTVSIIKYQEDGLPDGYRMDIADTVQGHKSTFIFNYEDLGKLDELIGEHLRRDETWWANTHKVKK